MKASLVSSLAAIAAVFVSFPALGHTILKNPPPISPDTNAKSGPCGCYFGAGPEDPNDDQTPVKCPDTYAITTLQAGTELKVDWQETVNHDGSFRVTFLNKSPDTVTKADMDAAAMPEIPDMNTDPAATLSQAMTVPSEPCDLCTIQVRQTMTGATPPYYYTCAAVKIVPAGGSSTSGGMGGGGAGGAGQGASNGGEAGSTGAGVAEQPTVVPAGCSATGGGPVGAGALVIAAVCGAAALRRRGRRGGGRGSRLTVPRAGTMRRR